ncbi:MAG: MerR family transcriptional regulator [Nocardioides sp.]|nr:MerR family transcriptional regulator [Nocardioides sp.]
MTDTGQSPLTTGAVSVASGYSAQQVRDLESRGVIPPASRAANGYREFASEHVRTLRAYRNLAEAIGPVRARRALRDVRSLATALLNLCAAVLRLREAEQTRSREQRGRGRRHRR